MIYTTTRQLADNPLRKRKVKENGQLKPHLNKEKKSPDLTSGRPGVEEIMIQMGRNLANIVTYWAGEMSQRLRALTVLLKVLSSNPRNHMMAHNHL